MSQKLLRRLLILLLVFSSIDSSLTSCSLINQTSGPITYYLSSSGNDTAAGTSPATAWRSLARASSMILQPGNRLLLHGGQQFNGSLTLGAQDAGSASRPVLIGSYGIGRARIVTNAPSGIAVYDTAGVTINDLAVIGTSREPKSGAGINVYSNLGGNRKLDYVNISDVSVSGFANGIAVGGNRGATGFQNVWISNSVLYRNSDSGMQVYGPAYTKGGLIYANENVNVSHVVAFDNRGDPRNHSYSTGNGIILASVKQGVVSWSAAYDNGGLGEALEGPEGIWSYNSTDITIEHDIAYDNRSANHIDGNGFGLDQNTSNSYLEYDLSYNNDGAGYFLYSRYHNKLLDHDVVKFCVSSGNDQGGNPSSGGIAVIGTVWDAAVYQNTVITQSIPNGSAALVLGEGDKGVIVRNNIFATQAGPIIQADAALPASTAILQGNDYYTFSPGWSILWGGINYSSLNAWRSGTGQETVEGKYTGFASNPEFIGPVLGLRQGTAAEAAESVAFMLQRRSPLIGTGLNLARLFSLNGTFRDFSGYVISAQTPDVGAE